METHGKIPKQNVVAVIPARYSSTRLEGKLLLPIKGIPLIIYTLERAKTASNVSRVIVATDDQRIKRVVEENGDEAVLTSAKHRSGSDRVAEVAEALPVGTLIVNIQGDEPLIPKRSIELAVDAFGDDYTIDIATTCERITDFSDVLDPDVVKVVVDSRGEALYFSRSPIPYPRESVNEYGSLEEALVREAGLLARFRKHTGLYVYRREFLLQFAASPQTRLEQSEVLEQLRALENGARIAVVEVNENSIGVDNREDFERVSRIIEKSGESVSRFG